MRFSEFFDFWKNKAIIDIGKVITGNTPPTKNSSYYGDSFNWAGPSDLGVSKYINDTKVKLSNDGMLVSRVIPKNSILVTCIGSTIGKMGISTKEMATNQQINSIIVNTKFNFEFIYYEILYSFKKYLKTIEVQAVPIISKSAFERLKIYVPSIDEQHKLAKFLTLIDHRIDTQSKIIEDLESFKNMISYKILYADKTACYKPLSSFSELKNGYAFKSTTYSSKGDYQIVTIANVSGDRYIALTSSNKLLKIPNDIQSHQILKINDILISLTGNVGRVSYCNKLNCLLNQRVGLLSIKNKDLIEYIFQCIHNKLFEKTMISRGQGVAQLNIGKNDVESFEIPVYSQDRMNTISEVLKSIDFKIIKEKDILELYKKQKAYLLKNMFI